MNMRSLFWTDQEPIAATAGPPVANTYKKRRKIGIFLHLILILMTDPVVSFKFDTGSCFSMSSASNFILDKFFGKWHVIQMTNTATRCYTMQFGPGSLGDITVEFKKQQWSLDAGGIKHKITYNAEGYIAGKSSAEILLSLPTEAFGAVALQVVDTDYKSFSLLWFCKNSYFGHLEAAAILSREKTLDKNTIMKLHKEIEKGGGKTEDISTVQHSGCMNGKSGTQSVVIEFQPSKGKPNNNYQSFFGGESTSGGVSTSGQPCYVLNGEYYYYYEECPPDAENPNYDIDYFNQDAVVGEPCYVLANDYYYLYDECPEDQVDNAIPAHPDEDPGSGDDTTSGSGTPCYVEYEGEYYYYEDCPDDAENPIFAQPDDGSADSSNSGDTKACYIREDEYYYYYDVCPEDAENPISVDEFDKLEVSGDYSYYYDDEAQSRSVSFTPTKVDRSPGPKGRGAFKIPNKLKWAHVRKEVPKKKRKKWKNIFELKKSVLRGLRKQNKRSKGKQNADKSLGKGKTKENKGNKQQRNKGPFKKPSSKSLEQLISTSKRLQRLLAKAGLDWTKLPPGTTFADLKSSIPDKEVWKKIKKVIRKRQNTNARNKKKEQRNLKKKKKENRALNIINGSPELQKLLEEAKIKWKEIGKGLEYKEFKKQAKDAGIWDKVRELLGRKNTKGKKATKKGQKEEREMEVKKKPQRKELRKEIQPKREKAKKRKQKRKEKKELKKQNNKSKSQEKKAKNTGKKAQKPDRKNKRNPKENRKETEIKEKG